MDCSGSIKLTVVIWASFYKYAKFIKGKRGPAQPTLSLVIRDKPPIGFLVASIKVTTPESEGIECASENGCHFDSIVVLFSGLCFNLRLGFGERER